MSPEGPFLLLYDSPSLQPKITLIGNNIKIRVNTKFMFRYNQEDNAPFNMVILRSSSWNGSIDLAAFFKSQFYLSQLERLRPIHMNTMEFHSVVAKSIFGAKLSNVNKPISRISDVIYLAETYQPSWNLFWYVSRAGTIWCQTIFKIEGHDYEGMASTIKISCDFDGNTWTLIPETRPI